MLQQHFIKATNKNGVSLIVIDSNQKTENVNHKNTIYFYIKPNKTARNAVQLRLKKIKN